MSYFLILILLLLLGTGAAAILLYFRPQYAPGTLLATAALLLVLWFPVRLALSTTPAVRQGEIGTLPSWSWYMSDAGWWLGLALILLLCGGALLEWVRRDRDALSLQAVLLSLLLVGTTLLAATADSLATLLAGWLLLDGIWFVLLFVSSTRVADRSAAWVHFLFPGATLFLLWLAALTLPEVSGNIGLDVHGWPALTRSLLLLAALIQIGAFPFHFWRPLSRSLSPLLALLLHTTPAVAGAALLVRVEAATDITLAFALPLTLVALLGMLWSANAAWQHSDDRPRMAALLGVGQAGLVLLAGTWAGPDAILAEARVLLLAGGVLLVAAQLTGTDLLARLGPLLALAALAGLPLTAGFAGRTAVYDAWLDGGRWLLVLVTALLHVPYIAAVLLLVWDKPPVALRRPQSGPALVTTVALLLPALGLLTFSDLAGASIIAWFAVLLPAGAAMLLVYYLEETDAARQTVREALSLPFDSGPYLRSLYNAVRAVPLALREAIAILEGERGLLWLLLFLLLIWLVR